jgi:hypothetical protein
MKTNNLLRLVKQYFQEGYFDTNIREILSTEGSTFNDEQIDYMWDYVFKIQNELVKSRADTMTMSTMKREIGRLIGVQMDIGYASSPVGKKDLYKIYMFITSLPKEYLKDRMS